MPRSFRVVACAFFIAMLIMVGCAWMALRVIYVDLDTKIDSTLYPAIAGDRIAQNPTYDFLPRSIPPDAEAIAFVHTPGFLQGGDTITLRMRLPQKTIVQLLADMRKSGRTEVKNFEPAPEPYCYPKWGLTETDLKKHNAENITELPEGFQIFLHHTDLQSIRDHWNHNFIAFTAISLERREVVYHVDNW